MSLPPITAALEAQISHEIRQHGLVIWLDKDGLYTAYVDDLIQRYQAGHFFAPVVAFRGSFLELLLDLETQNQDDSTAKNLLIHMPGHTEQTIRTTPVLELYHAGTRYRKGLDTLIKEAVSGQVSPDRLDAFLKTKPNSLSAAEAWFATLNEPQNSLAAYLNSLSLEWLLDGLLQQDESRLKQQIDQGDGLLHLQDHFYRHLGLSPDFLQFYLGPTPLTLENLTELCSAWLLCVEYVQDLQRSPQLEALVPLTKLATPLLNNCKACINHLRNRHPDHYDRIAQIVENSLEAELATMEATDLGTIDTFRAEEVKFLNAALEALKTQDWQQALTWATNRLQSQSFWLQRDRGRYQEWQFVQIAAQLGTAIATSGTPSGAKLGHLFTPEMTLRDALETYTRQGAKIDRLHRILEQQRSTQLASTLPDFQSLLSIADQLRQFYHTWASNLAADFAQICRREGFLPDSDLQQRFLYEELVQPCLQRGETVVYFLLDAFRYEMATELLENCQDSDLKSGNLYARYAELPTITPVGMNALAPLTQKGKLVLPPHSDFQGFRTGEYTVNTPGERVRAMKERGTQLKTGERAIVKELDLKSICDASDQKLKKDCAKADLLVVHGPDIDQAGEANQGVLTFDRLLQQIKTAWNRLRNLDDPAFTTFIFTADHGFLLRDAVTAQKANPPFKDGTQRRHILSREPRQFPETLCVSFSQLGYEGQSGYLHFRQDLAVYQSGSATFVHGGNSLQERVVPVLVLHQKNRNRLSRDMQYEITAEPLPPLVSYNRLRLKIQPAPTEQGMLLLNPPKTIALALQVPQASNPSPATDITVTLHDAPGAKIQNQVVEVPLSADSVEVAFTLHSPSATVERVRIQVYHPTAIVRITPVTPNAFFDVIYTAKSDPSTSHPDPQTPLDQPRGFLDWQEAIPDQEMRTTLDHIYKYGSITEVELGQMLGSPRKVRRFSQNLEAYQAQLPFIVKTESTANGKRYVSQNQNDRLQ